MGPESDPEENPAAVRSEHHSTANPTPETKKAPGPEQDRGLLWL